MLASSFERFESERTAIRGVTEGFLAPLTKYIESENQSGARAEALVTLATVVSTQGSCSEKVLRAFENNLSGQVCPSFTFQSAEF